MYDEISSYDSDWVILYLVIIIKHRQHMPADDREVQGVQNINAKNYFIETKKSS